jgi:hypothetical protein
MHPKLKPIVMFTWEGCKFPMDWRQTAILNQGVIESWKTRDIVKTSIILGLNQRTEIPICRRFQGTIPVTSPISPLGGLKNSSVNDIAAERGSELPPPQLKRIHTGMRKAPMGWRQLPWAQRQYVTRQKAKHMFCAHLKLSLAEQKNRNSP